MKIFITGATGFIGNHLLRILEKTEYESVCLVRNPNNKLKNFKTSVIEGDINDKVSLLKGMNGCDWVFHLAGLYSFWEPEKKKYKEINVTGTKNVMECALETKIKKVIHVSSVVTFGRPSVVPFNEDCESGERFSTYADTKFEGDKIIWDLYKNKNLPVVVIYPCSVIGAGNTRTSAKYIWKMAHNQMPATVFNDSTLTWVHVNDVAEAIIRAAEKEGNVGEKYLIGNEHLKFRDFNKMIHQISGAPLPKISMPNGIALTTAYLLTGISNIIKKEPPWGMSTQQMKTMKAGFVADGSKAIRELNLKYTPVKKALEEEIMVEE